MSLKKTRHVYQGFNYNNYFHRFEYRPIVQTKTTFDVIQIATQDQLWNAVPGKIVMYEKRSGSNLLSRIHKLLRLGENRKYADQRDRH